MAYYAVRYVFEEEKNYTNRIDLQINITEIKFIL